MNPHSKRPLLPDMPQKDADILGTPHDTNEEVNDTEKDTEVKDTNATEQENVSSSQYRKPVEGILVSSAPSSVGSGKFYAASNHAHNPGSAHTRPGENEGKGGRSVESAHWDGGKHTQSVRCKEGRAGPTTRQKDNWPWSAKSNGKRYARGSGKNEDEIPGFNGLVKRKKRDAKAPRTEPWVLGRKIWKRENYVGVQRAEGDIINYEGLWPHENWLAEFRIAETCGDEASLKALRQRVASHNYGTLSDCGNLGKIPETILVRFAKSEHSRVFGTGRDPIISVSGATTGEALSYFSRQPGMNTCGLNFANGQHVGGGYVRGAKAQEEDLCRIIPHLYTSLKTAKRKRRYPFGPPAGQEGYSDVLFTGNLLCCREEESKGYRLLRNDERFVCSIVSAAAPNLPKGEPFDRDKFINAIKNIIIAPRINAPYLNVLILGAWGCGAFRGDPTLVADCYIEVLKTPVARLWQEIHFPIPGAEDADNVREFCKSLQDAFPTMITLDIGVPRDQQ